MVPGRDRAVPDRCVTAQPKASAAAVVAAVTALEWVADAAHPTEVGVRTGRCLRRSHSGERLSPRVQMPIKPLIRETTPFSIASTPSTSRSRPEGEIPDGGGSRPPDRATRHRRRLSKVAAVRSPPRQRWRLRMLDASRLQVEEPCGRGPRSSDQTDAGPDLDRQIAEQAESFTDGAGDGPRLNCGEPALRADDQRRDAGADQGARRPARWRGVAHRKTSAARSATRRPAITAAKCRSARRRQVGRSCRSSPSIAGHA